MLKTRTLAAGFLLFICMCALLAACKKENDFIDEDKLQGVHFYPELLNDFFADTITHKRFSDTTFISGQRLVFEVDFRPTDSVQSVNLYAQPDGQEMKLVQSDASGSYAFSKDKQADTLFLSYTLPDSLASGSRIRIEAEIENKNGLKSSRKGDYLRLP